MLFLSSAILLYLCCVKFTQKMPLFPNDKKYCYKYPHPAVTTDCVIFGFDGWKLNVLLIRRGLQPFRGRWAFPGGFLNMDESAEDGAARELWEETGLRDVYIRQFHTFSDPDRDPRERVLTIAYYALVRLSEVRAGDDAERAEWFPVDAVPALAFDHDMILRVAIQELRKQIYFEPIGFELLPQQFTMTELQRLYEAILGVKFDRRNFHNKMMHLGILSQVEDKDEDAAPQDDAASLTPQSREERIHRFERPRRKSSMSCSEYDDDDNRVLRCNDAPVPEIRSKKAFRYQFNREKYEELKQKGLRLEF